MLTEFGIHYRLESCEPLSIKDISFLLSAFLCDVELLLFPIAFIMMYKFEPIWSCDHMFLLLSNICFQSTSYLAIRHVI